MLRQKAFATAVSPLAVMVAVGSAAPRGRLSSARPLTPASEAATILKCPQLTWAQIVRSGLLAGITRWLLALASSFRNAVTKAWRFSVVIVSTGSTG
jgi:hypothetical protein